jgi:hypothetical protein
MRVSFDDVCCASGVEPAALCGMLVTTAMRFGRTVADMVAAFMHPKVVAAQVASAERIDGDHAEIAYKDRIAFLQGMGSLPIPKGATLNVNLSASAQAAAASSAEPTVPSFAADLDTISARVVRQLPEADPALAPIEAVAVPIPVDAD